MLISTFRNRATKCLLTAMLQRDRCTFLSCSTWPQGPLQEVSWRQVFQSLTRIIIHSHPYTVVIWSISTELRETKSLFLRNSVKPHPSSCVYSSSSSSRLSFIYWESESTITPINTRDSKRACQLKESSDRVRKEVSTITFKTRILSGKK